MFHIEKKASTLYFYVCFPFDFCVVCVLLLRRINK